ncbi:MAG: serine hydroxymethyltransferase [Sphingomonadaceae bacterium]
MTDAVRSAGFFTAHLPEVDPEIHAAIRSELSRQQRKIELIASENITSLAVLEATGSVLTNKYAEGYPGKRYYGGCEYADVVENLAIERAKALFGCQFANVQPNSGSQMNQAVFLALLQPGDSFMGLNLNAGGHLTHGSPVNMSGKWFKPIPYGVRQDDELLDMDEVARLAREHKPKLIIAGGTAYSRVWDFGRFREIADEVGAWLLVDMSHFSGLVAGGAHPSPFPHAHVVTTTTHKSLRGPRSGVILTNDEDLAKKLNMAVFPGLQGGPLMHVVAAKAVAFGEALKPEFKAYAAQVVANARALAASLAENGLRIVSGGTDNHLMLVDLTAKEVTGKAAEKGLDRAYLTCNKNGIPYDTRSPFVTSGVRLGTPAGTTRGFREEEFRQVGALIAEVVEGLSRNGEEGDGQVEQRVRARVEELCARFPIYPEL